MREEFHELNAAAAVIRRLDRKAMSEKDVATLDQLLRNIDAHGETIALAIRMKRLIDRAISADKAEDETAKTVAIQGAVTSFVKLAKETGLSQLAKYETISRAEDDLGIEPMAIFTDRPGSDKDREENIGLNETQDGRAFLIEIIAQHLNLFCFGVAEHDAIKTQIYAMISAARGREVWPELIKKPRISPNTGKQHAAETFIAIRAGESQAISDHLGQKVSVKASLSYALAEYAMHNGPEILGHVAIPALLQRLQKDRDEISRVYKSAKKRAAAFFLKHPELPP